MGVREELGSLDTVRISISAAIRNAGHARLLVDCISLGALQLQGVHRKTENPFSHRPDQLPFWSQSRRERLPGLFEGFSSGLRWVCCDSRPRWAAGHGAVEARERVLVAAELLFCAAGNRQNVDPRHHRGGWCEHRCGQLLLPLEKRLWPKKVLRALPNGSRCFCLLTCQGSWMPPAKAGLRFGWKILSTASSDPISSLGSTALCWHGSSCSTDWIRE